jgi:enterochelin esterase family protein
MRIVMLALLGSVLCSGQATDDCKPSTLNIPGAQYPCVYPDHRATFRLLAPDAQKVQVRVGKTFDMSPRWSTRRASRPSRLRHRNQPSA